MPNLFHIFTTLAPSDDMFDMNLEAKGLVFEEVWDILSLNMFATGLQVHAPVKLTPTALIVPF